MDREKAWLLGFLVAMLVAGWVLYSIPGFLMAPGGGSFVESYDARLAGNTLTERYSYWVLGRHHYLYRLWHSPLYPEGAGEGPRVELLSIECPKGSVPYMRDSDGKLHVYGSLPSSSKGPEEALRGEAGCYFPQGMGTGSYEVTYRFRLYMPAHCGGGACFVELTLADQHIRYDSLHVSVQGVKDAALLAEDARASRSGSTWEASGWSPEDGVVKLYLLYPSPPPGAVVEKTGDAAADYSSAVAAEPGVRDTLKALAPLLIVAPAAAFAAVYLRWGVEREHPVVPEYTYYVPNKRLKPWQVNLLFGGRPGYATADAVAATVVDLTAKGVLRVSTGGEPVFTLPSGEVPGLDNYERRVLSLLRVLEGPPGVWMPRRVAAALGRARETAARLMRSLTGRVDDRLLSTYLELPPGWIMGMGVVLLVAAFILGAFVYLPVYAPWSLVPFLLAAGVGLGLLASSVAPPDIVGRWKPGARREAMEWWSFARTLGSLARLDVKLPQDVHVWKEWLSYGTALGVGERVVEALRLRGIYIPEMDAALYATAASAAIYSSTVASSSGGGTGGGGGGFGGGGAGVR